MDPLQLAAALAAANAAPSGGANLAHYQGEILSWDETSGVNAVKVNGSVVSNMKVVQPGIGLLYQPGDTVMVEKRMSQWYILGKVGAPGAGAANQIKSQSIVTSQPTTSGTFVDLATVGPQVDVMVGSSRRVLVMSNVGIDITIPAGTYGGGYWTLAVTGASTIVPSGSSTLFPAGGFFQFEADFIGTFTQTWVVTSAYGLNPGLNTFRLMYMSVTAGQTCSFFARTITAIPF